MTGLQRRQAAGGLAAALAAVVLALAVAEASEPRPTPAHPGDHPAAPATCDEPASWCRGPIDAPRIPNTQEAAR